MTEAVVPVEDWRIFRVTFLTGSEFLPHDARRLLWCASGRFLLLILGLRKMTMTVLVQYEKRRVGVYMQCLHAVFNAVVWFVVCV
jgi:hypothetical protein